MARFTDKILAGLSGAGQTTPLIDDPNFFGQFAHYVLPLKFRATCLIDGYEVSLKGPEGYAKRKIGNADLIVAGDPTHVFMEAIEDMKRELGVGHRAKVAADQTLIDKEEAAQLLVQAVADLKAEPKPKMLTCPEHGNVMEPAEEGALRCPIQGCSRVARKKTKVMLGNKPAEDVVNEINANLGENLLNPDLLPPLRSRTTMEALPPGKSGQGFNGQGARQEYLANEKIPELVRDGHRLFLRQQTDSGYVYIDLSVIDPAYTLDVRNGQDDIELLIHPLVIHPRPVSL
jgi:hypothetical protein